MGDPELLDGISQTLLQGAKIADVRAGMQYACAALQQGKVVTELSETSLGDFLVAKIARLPLGTRFPLMAEWTSRLPAGWNKAQSKSAIPIEGNFISFDDGKGGAHRQQDPLAVSENHAAPSRDAEDGKRKKD